MVLPIRPPPPSAAIRSANGQPKQFNLISCLRLVGTIGAAVARWWGVMTDTCRSTGARRVARPLAGVLMLATQLAAVLDPDIAFAAPCRPRRPLPTVILKSMGPCNFDADALSFAGNSVEQAECLIRPVKQWAHLGPPRAELPKALADRVSGAVAMPDRAALTALIGDTGLPSQFAEGLNSEVSRARGGDAQAPMARYFVIHDTSGPKLGSFPANLDVNMKINNLERFSCSDSAEIAHAFINRLGGVFFGHDFGVPWRSTKFERALSFGASLKGLFLHVEMIQPRRRGRSGRDIAAPTPGFTAVQYQRLALLYTIASVRAGAWLIPAFHAVIDGDISGGHDDPQNFDVDAFAQALDGVTVQLSAYNAPGANPSLNPDPGPSSNPGSTPALSPPAGGESSPPPGGE
jgi:hypothetical protein